jgi:hypothetical protein
MWLDVDALFLDTSSVKTMMEASTTKPLILIDHQTIPGHTSPIPFKFPNMGVMYVSDPNFFNFDTLKRTLNNDWCPGGLDQQLIWNYCKNIKYDYKHPDMYYGWNACSGYKKTLENGKIVASDIPEAGHEIYILHYWDCFKPWNTPCDIYNKLLFNL